MSDLYSNLRTKVQPDSLLNDSLLYVAKHDDGSRLLEFQTIVDNHRLDSEAAAELQSTLAYWEGRIAGAPDTDEEEKIKNEMVRKLGHAFLAVDRWRATSISEEDFYLVIGYTASAT